VTGDDLIQLFAEELNLHHRQNADKWKISPKSLKWTNTDNVGMKKNLRSDTLDGPQEKIP